MLFRFPKTACQLNPLPSDPTCSKALFAPQAELIGAIVQGAFGGDLNIQMVVLGAAIAVALIRLQMPVMSVAIGIYLPLGLSVPIMTGGNYLAHYVAKRSFEDGWCATQRAFRKGGCRSEGLKAVAC